MRMVFLVLGAVLCVVGMTGFPRANENEQAGRTVRQTTGSDGAILFANGTIYINADKKAHNLLVKDGKVAGWHNKLLAPRETTHAKLLKPAGLSKTRSIVKARIDDTPRRIFMRARVFFGI